MSEVSVGNIRQCTACACPMDMSSVDPFMSFTCPQCGHPLQVNCQLGQYLIVKAYAEGGMSRIYEARDTVLDRVVAIKILNENYSQDAVRMQQFEEEARITASISHPNVVRVFTAGQEFGRYYIVMEMVEGKSLEQRILDEKMIIEDEALLTISEVVSGLRAAKEVGLIHRDIKPGNILLDLEGHVKIVDFGLALMTQEGAVTAGELWATPYYVPPETLDGKEEDFRSDVYALGATLYHALSGKAPIPDDVKTTGSVRRAKEQVIPLAEVAPWLRPETCQLIDRAMAISPSDRFTSYREMEDACQRAHAALVEHQKTSTVSLPSPHQTTQSLARKRRSSKNMYAIGTIATLLLLGVAVYFLKQESQPNISEEVEAEVIQEVTTETDENIEAVDPVIDADYLKQMADLAIVLLREGRFFEAAEGFANLMQNEAVTQPEASWYGIESVIAHYLQGDGESAERAIRQLNDQLPPKDVIGDQLLTDISGQLQSLEPVSISDVGNAELAMPYYMVAALRNWDVGAWDEAISIFKQIKSYATSEEPEESRYQIYGELAGLYLADYEALSSFSMMEESQDINDARQRLMTLKQVMNSLETKGRARFFARNWQLRLHREIKSLVNVPTQ